MPWHPPEGTPSHPPRRVRTAGHPIYRPALPILPAWGNRSSLALGCPSNAADGTEQGLVFVGWPNRVPGGRLAESWISVLITLEITLNFVLRSARERVVPGPPAPRHPGEIRAGPAAGRGARPAASHWELSREGAGGGRSQVRRQPVRDVDGLRGKASERRYPRLCTPCGLGGHRHGATVAAPSEI